ncbi:hypothetical protein BJY59DRAFT_704092 [Rhodotorula toruloides]
MRGRERRDGKCERTGDERARKGRGRRDVATKADDLYFPFCAIFLRVAPYQPASRRPEAASVRHTLAFLLLDVSLRLPHPIAKLLESNHHSLSLLLILLLLLGGVIDGIEVLLRAGAVEDAMVVCCADAEGMVSGSGGSKRREGGRKADSLS